MERRGTGERRLELGRALMTERRKRIRREVMGKAITSARQAQWHDRYQQKRQELAQAGHPLPNGWGAR